MLLVLRQRNFRLLFLGGLVSSLGDWFLFLALPFYVYSLTGSALATGGTFIAESLPSILFGSVAGVFVDRWDRRRTMIVSDTLRAILLLGLLAVHSSDTVWIVFAVSFVQATIGKFFTPAKDALIPLLVGENDLLAANSLSSMGGQVAMLIGPALGGAALALSSVGRSLSPIKVLASGPILTGLFAIVAVSTVVLPVILVFLGLIGVAVVVFVIRLQTLLQVSVTDAYRGRVLGAYGTTQSALLLAGMALAGTFGGIIGPVLTLEFSGILYAAGGVATALILPRALRAFAATPAVAEVSAST